MMASKRNEQICALAGDAASPLIYYYKNTPKKVQLAKLTKIAHEYTLCFYKEDGKKPKYRVKLKQRGHNFILTNHQQNGYVRYDVFYFGDSINNISSYLSFEVSKSDTDFGDEIKKALQAFSHRLSVLEDGCIQQYVLHVSCRQLCVTNNDYDAIQFVVSPKDLSKSIIELKYRENIDVPTTQISHSDLKYYDLAISPAQPELFKRTELLIVTLRITEICQTFKSLLTKETFFPSGIPEIYDNSSSNTYSQHPSRRFDKKLGLPILTPSLYDEYCRVSGGTGPLPQQPVAQVFTGTKYGSKRRHGIYSYVKTTPKPDTSHTYEYVEFTGKKEKSILEYNELNNSSEEVLVNDKNEQLNFYVSVFGAPQTLTDCWCISIIITKFGDRESFQAIKEIEESADHHLISGCRDVRTNSDLLVDLDIQSKHFERFGEESERVSFNDLKSLTSSGMQSWIVIDMLVQYCNEEKPQTQFVGYLKLKSSAGVESGKRVLIMDKFPGEIKKTPQKIPNAVQSLFQSPVQRKFFKELLDMHDPLGHDWKYFADLMGLSQHDIRVVDSNRSGESYTEQVLMIVERRSPEKYNVHFVGSVLERMQRKDVLDIILDDRAVENCE